MAKEANRKVGWGLESQFRLVTKWGLDSLTSRSGSYWSSMVRGDSGGWGRCVGPRSWATCK